MAGAGDDDGPLSTIDASGLGPGALIGRYVIEQEIGRGAMGVVFRAYDPDVDRRVALKVLHELDPAAAPDASARRSRLVREARAMARLSHPNIVRVHDAGTDGALVYIAMDLVEGTTLRGWNAAARSLAEVLAVFDAAGRGLAAAHAAGLVHRDFKPDNVFVDPHGHVFVGDFGLVRRIGPTRPSARTMVAIDEGADDSQRGFVVGTPAYMSPEQLAGRAIDDRADQFSFCVALWEAVHGTRPFVGASLDRLVSAIMRHELAPTPAGKRVPSWLRATMLRGLRAHPGDRFPAMDALLEALRREPARRRNLAWLGAAGAVAIAAVAIGSLGPEPCPLESPPAWSAARRAALERAATGWAEGETVASTIALELDGWAERWTTARAESCAASLVRAERAASAWESARACLDRQDVAVDRLIDAIESGRPATGAEAVIAVHALTAPARCIGVGADVVPDDARVVAVAGGSDAAVDEAELDAAVRAAEPLHRDRFAAHAWARLAMRVALDPGRAVEAARLVALAHAAVERGGGDLRLSADIDDARARGLLASARAADAVEPAARALASREAELGARHPDVASSWLLLGRIDAARGDPVRALADDLRAIAILEEVFGARHPVAASGALRVADDLVAVGEHERAERWRARALQGLAP